MNKMIKFRLYFDKDRETAWLNELAMQGKAMSGFFAGFYQFEDTAPGLWRYQVDFSDRFGSVTQEYRSLMDDLQIEIVQIWGYWVILRKRAADGPFEMYTDADSKISHYKKIRKMFRVATLIYLALFILEMICAIGMEAPEGWLFMLILGLLTIGLQQQVRHISQIISQLMEQKGEQNDRCPASEKKQVSAILLIGLLLNICAVAIQPSTEFMHCTKLTVQVAAIIAMIVGIYRTRWVFKSKD
jgi:Protein of unknown function (DUF2812).